MDKTEIKYRYIASFLALFLGWIGINNVYTRNYVVFYIDVILFLLGICFGWGIGCLPIIANSLRGICYLYCCSDEDFVDKYVRET